MNIIMLSSSSSSHLLNKLCIRVLVPQAYYTLLTSFSVVDGDGGDIIGHHSITCLRSTMGKDPKLLVLDSNLAELQSCDLVLCVGGDGCLLQANELFQTIPIPPIVSFGVKSTGLMTPFGTVMMVVVVMIRNNRV